MRPLRLRGIDEDERLGQNIALIAWETRWLLLWLLEEIYAVLRPSEGAHGRNRQHQIDTWQYMLYSVPGFPSPTPNFLPRIKIRQHPTSRERGSKG